MGLFDNLETKAGEIAKKTGLSVAEGHAIANTFQANLTSSDGNSEEAIEAAAAQHGVDTGTVRYIISRAGGLESEIGDIAEHSVRPGGIWQSRQRPDEANGRRRELFHPNCGERL